MCRLRNRRAGRVGPAFVLWGVTAIPLLAQTERVPVPDESRLAQAHRLAQELYGEELEQAKTPDQLQALAGKLLQEAEQSAGDPAGRYVLLKLAADVAVRAGDGRTALRAIDRIGGAYDVDGIGMKTEMLQELSRSVRSGHQQRTFALHTIPLIKDAARQDDYEAAVRLGRMAYSAAQKSRDRDLAKGVLALNKQIQEAEKQYARVETARQTLEASPADPEANLVVGRYLCFVKGDWDRGVPMLALGNDPQLKPLAIADIQDPASAEAQAKLGDQWWQFAEDADERMQGHFQVRAAHWYRQALPQLRGLVKAKVEKRLEAAPERASSFVALPTPWVRIVNLRSGHCLAVRPGFTASGASVSQEILDESALQQQWEIVPLDAQWCAILNRQSGQALAPPAGSMTPRNQLIQRPFDRTSPEHHWTLVPITPGVCGILNRNSKLAVAVLRGSDQPGAPICQWPFRKDAEDHQWRPEPVLY